MAVEIHRWGLHVRLTVPVDEVHLLMVSCLLFQLTHTQSPWHVT
jgi:hypothetical protein